MTDRSSLSRRAFIKSTIAGAAVVSLGGKVRGQPSPAVKAQVALIKRTDRAKGVAEALKLISFPAPKGKALFIKPNFNTSDAPPGSTHNDTLRALILDLKARGAEKITIGDRSGPEPTAAVLEKKGIPALAAETGAEVINFEAMEAADWIHLAPAGSHWKDGFDFARPLSEAVYPVAVCCLKTHQFGGVFTMSLKLTVGAVHRKFMRELHGSADQRRMIAEINLGYSPKIVVMDGVDAFADGGPMSGRLVHPGVILAATDRIAIDAVGLAVLKETGSNEAVMSRNIFDQEQIRRAVELGLGIGGPDRVEIVTADPESRIYAEKLRAILAKEGKS